MQKILISLKHPDSIFGLVVAVVIKIILIINFLYLLSPLITGTDYSSLPPLSPISQALFVISFINALLASIWWFGIVGLIIIPEFKLAEYSWPRKLLYFIAWYLILNLVTVTFFTSPFPLVGIMQGLN
jgi:hypothetical protein